MPYGLPPQFYRMGEDKTREYAREHHDLDLPAGMGLEEMRRAVETAAADSGGEGDGNGGADAAAQAATPGGEAAPGSDHPEAEQFPDGAASDPNAQQGQSINAAEQGQQPHNAQPDFPRPEDTDYTERDAEAWSEVEDLHGNSEPQAVPNPQAMQRRQQPGGFRHPENTRYLFNPETQVFWNATPALRQCKHLVPWNYSLPPGAVRGD